MKKIVFKDTQKNDFLKLFASILSEMLFYFSHDSYQYPALNFKFLCNEIYSTTILIEKGLLKEGNILPLFDELEFAFENDIVCKSRFPQKFSSIIISNRSDMVNSPDYEYKNISNSTKLKIKRLKSLTSFFIEYWEDTYVNQNRKLISDMILDEANHTEFDAKFNLFLLSRSYTTDLINSGYSQEYIRKNVYKHLINSNKDSVEDILSDFFKSFDFSEEVYTVKVNVNEDVEFVKFICDSNSEISQLSENELSYQTKQLDSFSALSSAENALDFYISLYGLSAHLKNNNIKYNINIYHGDQILYFDEVTPPILRIYNYDRISGTPISKTPHPDFSKVLTKRFNFFTAIKTHYTALNSNECSNQLLNLWTCLEILIESRKDENLDRINQISNVLTRILNQTYIKSLFEYFYSNLKDVFGKDAIEKIIGNGTDLPNYKKLAIAVLKDDSESDESLYSLINSDSIALFRYQHLRNAFGTKTDTMSTLIKHKRRVEWHIMRIYRTRNSLIHEGDSFPYMRTLIKNLHYYVDVLFGFVSGHVDNLEYCYTESKIKESQYHQFLNSKGEMADSETILKCLFWDFE